MKRILKEAGMFTVSEKASEMIKDFLKDKDDNSFIRVFLTQGGWSGPSLGMALDEPKEGDETFKDNGVNYLVEKNLYEQVKPINVDFVESAMGSGFSITSNMSQGNSCGSCSC